MSNRLPHYYTRLRPFRECFTQGLPILTYHKLGPRPRGVRLKGLYVSEALFARQLAELRHAGFAATPLTQAVAAQVVGQVVGQASRLSTGLLALGEQSSRTLEAGGKPRQQIVLTFDDGFSNVLRYGLESLTRNQFRAIEFLVSDLIGKTNEWEQREGEVPEPLMDDAQIRGWLAAGHQIGSHTRTHPWLTRLAPAAAREEVVSSKKALEDRFGVPVEHFCYPFGDWNETACNLVLEAGYKTACTTEPGVNTAADSPFALKRFTARYPSRNLKAIWARLRER